MKTGCVDDVDDAISSMKSFNVYKDELKKGKEPSVAMKAGVAAGGGGLAVAGAQAGIAAAGFTSTGITGGSLAASIMSFEAGLSGGGVAAGGVTATLQSAGAVGMGLTMAVPIAVLGAGIGAGVLYHRHQRSKITIGEMGRDLSALSHANIIALHEPSCNRFIRMKGDSVDAGGGTTDVDKLPVGWDAEQFLVVHVDDTKYAFYSLACKKYMRMNKNGKILPGSEKELVDDVDDGEKFDVIDEGNGMISLYSDTGSRFVKIENDKVVRHSGKCPIQVVVLWTHERTPNAGHAEQSNSQ